MPLDIQYVYSHFHWLCAPKCALYSMCAFKVQTITIQYSNRYSMLNEQPNSQSVVDIEYTIPIPCSLIVDIASMRKKNFCSSIYMFYLLINRIKKNSIDNSFGVTSLIHWVEIDRIMWMLTLFLVNNKTIDHIHATDLGEKTVYSNSCLNNWTWIGNKSEIQNRWIQAIQTRNFNMILMIFTCLWKRN